MDIKRNYKKFRRGFNGSAKEQAGIPIDSKMKTLQWGMVTCAFLSFVARWVLASTIAFAVFRYGDKVIEWALK